MMKKKPILILGGYGGVGRTLARLLLRETQVDIIIAGRRKPKADEFAYTLRQEFPDNRVHSRYADASNQESLIDAFKGVQLVIVLSTTPNWIAQIGRAALISGCDYLDILVSDSAFHDLNELTSSITQQNRIFITQAGFHPGLPAVFVRYGAQYFDTYERATIAMAMNTRLERPEQAAEIIPMIAESKAKIYKAGAWRKATYKDAITIDMGNQFGKKKLYPIHMAELKQAQKICKLDETGAYVSGFNWFVDYLVLPLILVAQKIKKGWAARPLSKLFTWGVNTFSSAEQGVVFLNEATGIKDGLKITVRIIAKHEDAYLLTAIPVVACLKQYLDGKLPPGLWMMGHVVDDKLIFHEMEEMGVKIRTEILHASSA